MTEGYQYQYQYLHDLSLWFLLDSQMEAQFNDFQRHINASPWLKWDDNARKLWQGILSLAEGGRDIDHLRISLWIEFSHHIRKNYADYCVDCVESPGGKPL